MSCYNNVKMVSSEKKQNLPQTVNHFETNTNCMSEII